MIQNVPTNATNEDLANMLNKVINELNNKEKNIIFKDTSGTRTVVLNSDGLKTSDGSVDAFVADNSELTFNSNQNVFKIANTVSGSIAIDFAARAAPGADTTFQELSTNTLTIAHGLSTVPAIAPFLYDSTSGVYAPAANGSFLAGPGWSSTNPITAFQGTTVGSMATAYMLISVDSTNITIRGVRSGWARNGVTVAAVTYPSITFKIYCLQETAN